jgi:hypothetical protein
VANGDYATELDSLDAAHARSPMANGDYATELLIWTPHTPAYGKGRLRDSRTDSDTHSVTHTPAHQW